MGTKILQWPRPRHLVAIGADAVIILICYYAVLIYRSEGDFADWESLTVNFAIFAGMAIAVHVAANWLTGVYSIMARYMSLTQAVRAGQAGIIAVAILFVLVAAWPLYTGQPAYLVPRSAVVGGGMAAIVLMITVRFMRRVIFESTNQPEQAKERLLLVGAGQAADMLLREIKRTPALNMTVVGLVDDRPALQNMNLQGYPVLGRVADAPAVAEQFKATQIIVAIPSASAEEIVAIHRTCKPADLPMKVLPSLAELVSGRVSVRDARDLDIRDLLERPSIGTDVGAISEHIQGSTVLVTGGGGSIGSELCRQIVHFGPQKLVIVDHDESSLYDLHESLQNAGFTRYVLYPANILHERKLEKIFALHQPRLVFHAAAYKHVPLMELSPDEAVLNNVKGTYCVADAAGRYGVERFVNISTDKAVEPCNVMGATKRAGELTVRMLAHRYPQTLFASVRFGNVLGSQGSVIPIFKSQIENGGPLVITHPDMTRYFMLIEEAVQLVLQAAVLADHDDYDAGRSLDTFILEMGKPVSIVDLAQRMIEFYWKDNPRSLGVEFSGLRPGEKLEERLAYAHEEVAASSHPMIKRVYAKAGSPSNNGARDDHFEQRVVELIRLADYHGDKRAIIGALMACVPEYTPMEGLAVEKPAAVV
jgi:FlaA1/EpsC-like NDP-sugar epimerase